MAVASTTRADAALRVMASAHLGWGPEGQERLLLQPSWPGGPQCSTCHAVCLTSFHSLPRRPALPHLRPLRSQWAPEPRPARQCAHHWAGAGWHCSLQPQQKETPTRVSARARLAAAVVQHAQKQPHSPLQPSLQ